jgi:hypothetical protein
VDRGRVNFNFDIIVPVKILVAPSENIWTQLGKFTYIADLQNSPMIVRSLWSQRNTSPVCMRQQP